MYSIDTRLFQQFQLLLPERCMQSILLLQFRQTSANPFFHFTRGFARKGNSQNIGSTYLFAALPEALSKNVDKTFYENTCFTTAGAGRHRYISIQRLYRFLLGFSKIKHFLHRLLLPVRRRPGKYPSQDPIKMYLLKTVKTDFWKIGQHQEFFSVSRIRLRL